MNNTSKTGIVIVSYNAFDAVKVTLASIRRANNLSHFKLVLVDNASEVSEQSRIRDLMADHIAEIGEGWAYIEQQENLGFSGGNNVGIQMFMADPEITHVCLLNSDVIVTDHWLDRLLEYRKDVISPVTNRADGEQCIPIDYEADLSEFVQDKNLVIPEAPYLRVQNFAERWNRAWKGNIVANDVTFFCVLLSRKILNEIGLLDDVFFPGGFEDDDYCLRAFKAGYKIYMARDVFVHHWGSASFGKLQYEYFSARAEKNKKYLEKKHSIIWRRRPEKPILSFVSDIEFSLKKGVISIEQSEFLRLHRKSLYPQITYFEKEFSNLSNALNSHIESAPIELREQVLHAKSYGDLGSRWQSVNKNLEAILKVGGCDECKCREVIDEIRQIALGVYARVASNFAVHSFVTHLSSNSKEDGTELPQPSSFAPQALPAGSRLSRGLALVRKGLKFIRQFNGIVFFGGYFYPERQSDGYFQRIQIVDRLFQNHWRVYVETEELRGRRTWFERPEPGVVVLRVTGGRGRKIMVRLFALAAVIRSRKIYFHSVLRMYDNRFGRLLYLPFVRKAVDIHGVVPEEFRMHNDFFSALIFDREEHLAVKKAGIVIVVTNAMSQYLQQKFREDLQAKTIEFPMFPGFAPHIGARPLVDGKPIVVYAGGLHKWQQVPKMIDAIIKTSGYCQHHFYCPEPDAVKAMIPDALFDHVTVDAKPHAELMKIYVRCHYGFILREDIIVNRVACPTKLVEYIAMGIVPVVDCEDVGDFKALGMRFITLTELLAAALPDEDDRLQMAAHNLQVYEKLKLVRQLGAREIYDYFISDSNWKAAILKKARQALPAHTLTGRVSRRVWGAVAPMVRSRRMVNPTTDHDVVDDALGGMQEECDILVQVENFEAGGLENVVIDLNKTLAEAEYNVVLLVLGSQGPAVQKAKQQKLTVVSHAYSSEAYARIIDRLKPKLVMGHYCNLGVEVIHERGIPFVQVLHNIYMWFNELERQRFAREAVLTRAFVAVSGQVKEYSVIHLGVPEKKCIVIPNGIETSVLNASGEVSASPCCRGKFGFGDDDFVFIDVGAINHQKNHLGTLRAFFEVQRECPNAKLLILGPAYERHLLQELEDYIVKNGLQGKAVYGGAVSGVRNYLAMADAFVSGTFFEGGPLTLLEALNANLPVIISDVGHASSFAGRMGVNLVKPAFDIAAYKGCISEMKSDAAFEKRLAEVMIRVCRFPVRPNLSEDELRAIDRRNTYGQYLNLLTGILDGNPLADVDRLKNRQTVAELN